MKYKSGKQKDKRLKKKKLRKEEEEVYSLNNNLNTKQNPRRKWLVS